jgi:muconolactone delta-isomerase
MWKLLDEPPTLCSNPIINYNHLQKEAKMLYITNCELKSGYPLPPKEWMQLVLKGMEDLMDLKKQGKVVMHIGHAGLQAGTIIWDVDSNEELMDLLSRQTFWPFMEWQIIPGIPTEKTLESLKGALAAVQ